MGQQSPFFSIIVPTYNRPEQLAACLQSLACLDYPRDRFEVIVVDDGGVVRLDDVVADHNPGIDVTLLYHPHSGPGAARNAGARRAKGEFLAYTGDDCTPAPDWLRALASRFAMTPDCALGGKILCALPDNHYSTASHLLIDYLYSYYNASPNAARFFTPNNLAFPTDRFNAFGGFDAMFVRGTGEDRELCARWLQHGYRMVYAAEVVVSHTHVLTFGTFCRQHFNYGRGTWQYRQTQAQKETGRIILEPLRFYFNLLRYPLSQSRDGNKVRLTLLMSVAQAANAAGFFWEKKVSNK